MLDGNVAPGALSVASMTASASGQAPGSGPARVQVALRWGTTVLTSRRVDRRAEPVQVAQDTVLVWSARGLELVGPQGTSALAEGALLRRDVGGLELTVDARAVESTVFGRRAIEARFLSSDLFSLIVHVGLALLMIALHAPLTEAEMELPAPIAAEPASPALIVSTDERSVETPTDAPDVDARGAGASSEQGAIGSGRTPVAALGQRQAVQQGQTSAPAMDKGSVLREAASFGLIGLLPGEDAMPASAWAGEGELAAWGKAEGPSWGAGSGVEDGLGGLSLSGVGEGAGGRGAGIGRGDVSYATGAMSLAHGRGRLGGRHSVRMGPTWVCGSDRVEDCKSTVTGRLPAETIQRAVRQSFGLFRSCYTPLLRENPSLTARVVASFVIGRDGAVHSATGSGDGPSALTSCVVRHFYGVTFPAPEGGVVTVTYPIVFSPE